MWSLEDIASMKLSAAAGRGSKKDFFDIYELLQHHSFDQLLLRYTTKYPTIDTYHIIRSLVYFEDAQAQEDPIMIREYTRSQVQ